MKYIGVMATGYNVVCLKAAGERHIPVTNVPAYGTKSVAQMAEVAVDKKLFTEILSRIERLRCYSV